MVGLSEVEAHTACRVLNATAKGASYSLANIGLVSSAAPRWPGFASLATSSPSAFQPSNASTDLL